MVIKGHSASLALLLSVTIGVADAIRSLKDGPMIDTEGREYKSALRTDAGNIRGQQLNDKPTVRVQCTETSMIVAVKADLYKNGRLVSPGELFLGEAGPSQSVQCQAVAAGDTEYVIEAGLQDCGTKLTVSGDSVIYSNQLVISPAASYHGITRMTHTVVPVSCHYKRTHFVSSSTQSLSMSLSAPAKARPAFSLKLMTDDWTSETFSNMFYLGDLLHLEASYTGPDSVQRRLFIDSCVATLSPDTTSVPRYYFIENNGCLIDAKDGGFNTQFQPRTRNYSLQLRLNAFLFHHDTRNSIFITCHLKATSKMQRSSPINKACNYVQSRWQNVDGGDDVCRCCDSTCNKSSLKWYNKTNLRRLIPEDDMACGNATIGPLMIFTRK
ncbi:Zona pellucida sperm-binding protein 3 [Larimichthys crocea]|uniref:Zona pellucida sperm-binding protein 3 n=1 Tax=Larimichthys crocea TaxID=215358 RepID=A0A6G0HVK9_LARCR|nr:Zona pellucida sperm-binding protein 3 [Larimichthys crocea]